ncbi:MAG: DedA family protein [Burkholderiaceae bacterium]
MGHLKSAPWVKISSAPTSLTNARVDEVDAFFARHGSKAVFLGRFVGFACAIVPFLAGSSKMPYCQFLPYNVFGAALWSSAVVLLRYFLGASWHTAER